MNLPDGSKITYKEFQRLAENQLGYSVQTCWIADLLRLNGKQLRQAPNRKDASMPQKPCPLDKRPAIEDYMRKLGII
jgi:hypothetical protein